MPITPCPTAADLKTSPAGPNKPTTAVEMETNNYKNTNERRHGTLIQPNCKQFHTVISENFLLTLTVGGDE